MESKTLIPKQDRQGQKWCIIDAEGKVLGRLASKIATLIRGKNNPFYTPHLDMGAYVIVINAGKVAVTGKKLTDKEYIHYTGYPGGLRRTSVRKMLAEHPERVVKEAVKGMLPHNRLGRRLNKKLFIYLDKNHPHAAQKPEKIDF